MMNPKISHNINQWNIKFDPYGFISNENWLSSADKVEDILQLEHIYADGPVIDVGYYGDLYKIFVVVEGGWDNPIESYDSKSPNDIADKLIELIDKYANGV